MAMCISTVGRLEPELAVCERQLDRASRRNHTRTFLPRVVIDETSERDMNELETKKPEANSDVRLRLLCLAVSSPSNGGRLVNQFAQPPVAQAELGAAQPA